MSTGFVECGLLSPTERIGQRAGWILSVSVRRDAPQRVDPHLLDRACEILVV